MRYKNAKKLLTTTSNINHTVAIVVSGRERFKNGFYPVVFLLLPAKPLLVYIACCIQRFKWQCERWFILNSSILRISRDVETCKGSISHQKGRSTSSIEWIPKLTKLFKSFWCPQHMRTYKD